MKSAERIREIVKDCLGDKFGYPEVYGGPGDYGVCVASHDGDYQLTFATLEILSRRLMTTNIDISGKAEVRWSEDTYEGAETRITIEGIPFKD